MTTAFRETRDKDRTSVPVSTNSRVQIKEKQNRHKRKKTRAGVYRIRYGLAGRERKTDKAG